MALHLVRLPSEVMSTMGLFSFVMGTILLLVRNKLRNFEKMAGEVQIMPIETSAFAKGRSTHLFDPLLNHRGVRLEQWCLFQER